MLSPQDFARVLQDKLIESGENRPLEFKADLFALLPVTGSLAGLMPLDSYYRYYLAANDDTQRQRVVRTFIRDWKWYSQAVTAATNRALATGAPPVAIPPPTCQPPSSLPSTAFIVRSLITVASIAGLTLVCLCCLPNVMGLVMFNLFPDLFPDIPNRAPPPGAQLSKFIGGRGGVLRYYFDPGGQPLIGLAYATDEWSGQPVLGSLVGVFDEEEMPRIDFGDILQVVRAKEGYVVGGLEVDAGDYVNAVRITFVRRTDQGLDLSDNYQSDWLGTPTPDKEPRKLAGSGEEVIGIATRQGSVLDSVALLYKPARQAHPAPVLERAPGEPVADNPFAQPASPIPAP